MMLAFPDFPDRVPAVLIASKRLAHIAAMAKKPSTSAVSTPSEPISPQTRYEDALAELEGLVARMEAGDLALDDLLGQYRRGAQLLQFCRDRLAQVETQVQLLEDGELKPWRGGA